MGYLAAYQEYLASTEPVTCEEKPNSLQSIKSDADFLFCKRSDPNVRFRNLESIKVLVDFNSSNEANQTHFLNTGVFDYHYAFVVKYFNEKRYACVANTIYFTR